MSAETGWQACPRCHGTGRVFVRDPSRPTSSFARLHPELQPADGDTWKRREFMERHMASGHKAAVPYRITWADLDAWHSSLHAPAQSRRIVEPSEGREP